MKLTSKRLSIEDFQGQSEWIGPLLSSFNQTLQELQALNSNQITISDNLNQELLEVKFLNDSVAFPIKVKTKFNVLPKGLMVIYCVDTEGNSSSDYPWINWSFNNQLLTINSITNLTSNKTYTVRINLIYS